MIAAKAVAENRLSTPFCSDITIPIMARSRSTGKARTFISNHCRCDLMQRGTDIREFSASSWRRIIGVVPQDPVLFSGTIAENIAFGNADVTREEVEDAAREANCEFIWGMPQGFDTPSMFYQHYLLTLIN